ncbi:MAG TPA: MMPL family transporter, partial [Micromonosporaceae bacterium]|nr:MMPL family transporter [Micromonosporaceae bacterium]
RWIVLAAWLLTAGGGVLAAGPVFESMEQDSRPESAESIQAYDVLADGRVDGGEIVGLVDRVDPAAAPVRAAVSAAAADLTGVSGVRRVGSPYVPEGGAAYVARDGRALIVVVDLADLGEDAGDERDRLRDAVTRRLGALDGDLAAAGQPDAAVRLGGGTLLDQEVNRLVEEDINRGERLPLLVTLIVLVFVFGGVVAAGLPVLAAIVSAAAAMIMLLGFAQVTQLNSDVVTVVTLLGLGLSIDYGLLLVARYREEISLGRAPDVAIGRAWATAGRTVLFSALSIAAALAGLMMFDLSDLVALGAGGISIALVALLVGLTFTAALIGLLHRWVGPSERARRRAERRAARRAALTGADGSDPDEHGFFAGLARAVQRRPLLVALVTSAGLLAAGVPLLSADVHLRDADQIPRSIESILVADELAERFGQSTDGEITVVARTDPATLDAWASRGRDDPAVRAVQPAEAAGPALARVDFVPTGDSQDDAARGLVDRLRADRPEGVESWVTGRAAVLTDALGLIRDGLPAAIGLTLVTMFVLLFLFTGSVVVPIKAVLANVVSLGATFGVMKAVFADGFLAGPLDTITVGSLDPFVIVVVFAFAFGLSMDYEVFLLGRIKEFVDAGLSTDAAVRRGLQHTGRIITSAALLMIIVFTGFAAARMGQIEQLGLGLATAVLIDATIVRCLLVPATMTLLGRWNWWAPGWARRVHERFGLREGALAADAAADHPADGEMAGVR